MQLKKQKSSHKMSARWPKISNSSLRGLAGKTHLRLQRSLVKIDDFLSNKQFFEARIWIEAIVSISNLPSSIDWSFSDALEIEFVTMNILVSQGELSLEKKPQLVEKTIEYSINKNEQK